MCVYIYIYIYIYIWQATPKNLPRMQRTRAIPVAWLSSGLCPDRPKGWIPIIIIIYICAVLRRLATPSDFRFPLHLNISKGVPRQDEVAQGVPGRLRPQISWRYSTTRVVGRQPNAPATFTPGEVPGTHFQRLSRPQGTWFCRGYHEKNHQWHHRESIPGLSD